MTKNKPGVGALLQEPEPLGHVFDPLRKKQFTLKDAALSSRVFHHWRLQGLIVGAGEENKVALLDFPQYLPIW